VRHAARADAVAIGADLDGSDPRAWAWSVKICFLALVLADLGIWW
jgi:hypothetical protein